MNGFTHWTNEMGMESVRLHYSADQSKGEEWYERTRRLFPNPVQWQQEMEISFWVASGTRVYPEFSETLHCMPLEHRPRKVIYRSWDFGYLAPACLIAQIDMKDRLWVLREIVGKEEVTKAFAQKVIARCAEWYPNHSAGFQDFCDPAGQHASSTASEKAEVRDIEILNTLGIFPKWEWGWSRKDGRSLVHQLLGVRVDGSPSIVINGTQCPILLQGFLGKYVYPPKKGGQVHDEPDEAQHPWADAHAALRYLATGLYSALGLRRGNLRDVAPPPKLDYMGYGTPVRRR